MTKNWQKIIKSLHQKKHRTEENLFLVEGAKSVSELIQNNSKDINFIIKGLFYTEDFYKNYAKKLTQLSAYQAVVSEKLLEQNGTLQTNDGALAVVEIPKIPTNFILQNYALALADIRDPGNLGAIIRIADWYGIKEIICSQTTVDWYNPKVIIASMGSFLRVKPYYCELDNFLTSSISNGYNIYGMFLEGENLHKIEFAQKGIIVIGNESNGISEEITKTITNKITIQQFGQAESLNAAMATAVVCDNLRRYISI